MTKSLRDQLYDVARRVFDDELCITLSFPAIANILAVQAFIEGWDRDAWDTRVVLRVNQLLDKPGCISDDEPGLTENDVP